jgi:hypothetical protein
MNKQLIITRGVIEVIEQFKIIISDNNEKNSLVNEFEEFGFTNERLEKNFAKSSNVNINSLISKLIEYKEKRKEL